MRASGTIGLYRFDPVAGIVWADASCADVRRCSSATRASLPSSERSDRAVALRLTALKVPFVFHSGFARDTETFVARSTAPHLRKPASTEDLIAALDIGA